MKLYVIPNDTSIYQKGKPSPGMIEVPPQYGLADLPYLQITPNGDDYDFYLDTATKIAEATAAADQKLKDNQVKFAYDQMNADIYSQMSVVFATSNADSASAYEATWRIMLESASEFSGLGLTSRFAVAGFQIGDALDTDQKIADYATAKLAEVLEYGKYRMQRIEQFRQERETILG